MVSLNDDDDVDDDDDNFTVTVTGDEVTGWQFESTEFERNISEQDLENQLLAAAYILEISVSGTGTQEDPWEFSFAGVTHNTKLLTALELPATASDSDIGNEVRGPPTVAENLGLANLSDAQIANAVRSRPDLMSALGFEDTATIDTIASAAKTTAQLLIDLGLTPSSSITLTSTDIDDTDTDAQAGLLQSQLNTITALAAVTVGFDIDRYVITFSSSDPATGLLTYGPGDTAATTDSSGSLQMQYLPAAEIIEGTTISYGGASDAEIAAAARAGYLLVEFVAGGGAGLDELKTYTRAAVLASESDPLGNERQQIALPADAIEVRLDYGAESVDVALDLFDRAARAAAIEQALGGLTTIGEVAVAVSGSVNAPYEVVLIGAETLAGLSLDRTPLVGETWTLTWMLEIPGSDDLSESVEHLVVDADTSDSIATLLAAALDAKLATSFGIGAIDDNIIATDAAGSRFILKFEVSVATEPVFTSAAQAAYRALQYAVTKQAPVGPAEVASVAFTNDMQTVEIAIGSEVTFRYGMESVKIANLTAGGQIEAVLEAFDALREVNVSVTGPDVDDTWVLHFTPKEAGGSPSYEQLFYAVTQSITNTKVDATPVEHANGVQSLGAAGDFTSLWVGASGAALDEPPLNADDIEDALELLPSVSRVEVSGTGSVADPWKVVFIDAMQAADGSFGALRGELYGIDGTAIVNAGRAERHALQARSADQAFFLAEWQEYAELVYGAERVEISRDMSLAQLEEALESLGAIRDVSVSGTGTSDNPRHVAFLDADRGGDGMYFTLLIETSVQRMTRVFDVTAALNGVRQWIPAVSVVEGQELNYAGISLPRLDTDDIDMTGDFDEQARLLEAKLRQIPDLSRIVVTYDSDREAYRLDYDELQQQWIPRVVVAEGAIFSYGDESGKPLVAADIEFDDPNSQAGKLQTALNMIVGLKDVTVIYDADRGGYKVSFADTALATGPLKFDPAQVWAVELADLQTQFLPAAAVTDGATFMYAGETVSLVLEAGDTLQTQFVPAAAVADGVTFKYAGDDVSLALEPGDTLQTQFVPAAAVADGVTFKYAGESVSLALEPGDTDTIVRAEKLQAALTTLAGLGAVTVEYDNDRYTIVFSNNEPATELLTYGPDETLADSAPVGKLQDALITLTGLGAVTVDYDNDRYTIVFSNNEPATELLTYGPDNTPADSAVPAGKLQDALITLTGLGAVTVSDEAGRYSINFSSDEPAMQLLAYGADNRAASTDSTEQWLPALSIRADTVIAYDVNSFTLVDAQIDADTTLQAGLLQTELQKLAGLEEVTVSFDAEREAYKVTFVETARGAFLLRFDDGQGKMAASNALPAIVMYDGEAGFFDIGANDDLANQWIDRKLIVEGTVFSYQSDDTPLLSGDIIPGDGEEQAAKLQTVLATLTGEPVTVRFDELLNRYHVNSATALSETLRYDAGPGLKNAAATVDVGAQLQLPFAISGATFSSETDLELNVTFTDEALDPAALQAMVHTDLSTLTAAGGPGNPDNIEVVGTGTTDNPWVITLLVYDLTNPISVEYTLDAEGDGGERRGHLPDHRAARRRRPERDWTHRARRGWELPAIFSSG